MHRSLLLLALLAFAGCETTSVHLNPLSEDALDIDIEHRLAELEALWPESPEQARLDEFTFFVQFNRYLTPILTTQGCITQDTVELMHEQTLKALEEVRSDPTLYQQRARQAAWYWRITPGKLFCFTDPTYRLPADIERTYLALAVRYDADLEMVATQLEDAAERMDVSAYAREALVHTYALEQFEAGKRTLMLEWIDDKLGSGEGIREERAELAAMKANPTLGFWPPPRRHPQERGHIDGAVVRDRLRMLARG